MPSVFFSIVRYLRTNAAVPRCWSCLASAFASRSIASATNPPPGARMTPVPVALALSGRYAVNVGVTTFRITVPSGVLVSTCSCCVHCSDPGATPGQMFTVCASTAGGEHDRGDPGLPNHRHTRTHSYGSAYAIYTSLDVDPNLPPPAAMTTYCLPP